MEKELQNILNALYEGEALLEMALRRPAGERYKIVALARQKCFEIADLAARLPEEHTPTSVEEEEGKEDDAEKMFVEKIAPSLEAPSPVPLTTPYPSAAQLIEGSAEEEESEEESRDDIENESVAAEQAQEDLEEMVDATEQEEEQEATTILSPSVSRMISKERRPIATFFSINDKFRFRRELCAGVNARWLEMLSALENMNNLSEANAYLAGNMGLNPEDAEVLAFTQILEKYYES